jgi:hypothetical protein
LRYRLRIVPADIRDSRYRVGVIQNNLSRTYEIPYQKHALKKSATGHFWPMAENRCVDSVGPAGDAVP